MREAITSLASRRNRGQHAGLLLHRFLAEAATGENGNPEEKRALLNAAISAADNSVLHSLYKPAFERWKKSLPDLTTANDFSTEGRLIVGLGTENVLETGIRLHHTYGLPIIPGSALKGLAAHYCHEAWGQLSSGENATEENKCFRRGWSEEGQEYHRLLFGATDDGGCLVFHDAWLLPDSRNPLVMDVMTPHHPKWIDGKVPPTDFDRPIPVPFVSVSGKFRIAVSWNGPMSEKAACWTNLGFELLTEALQEWGVGGKTSSGYGRLIEVDANRRKPAYSAEALGLPTIGSLVTAIVLKPPKKTNQPWRAKIVLHTGEERSGPIEPIEQTPSNMAPGKEIQLVVTHVDERAVRFTWPK